MAACSEASSAGSCCLRAARERRPGAAAGAAWAWAQQGSPLVRLGLEGPEDACRGPCSGEARRRLRLALVGHVCHTCERRRVVLTWRCRCGPPCGAPASRSNPAQWRATWTEGLALPGQPRAAPRTGRSPRPLEGRQRAESPWACGSRPWRAVGRGEVKGGYAFVSTLARLEAAARTGHDGGETQLTIAAGTANGSSTVSGDDP